jgi:perosamine synthetase
MDSNLKFDYVTLGYNFRMATIVAALALAQMKKLDEIIQMRRNVASFFDKSFSITDMTVPYRSSDISHVYQMYSVRFPNQDKRDEVRARLAKDRIMSKIYFDPIHETHFYKNILSYKYNLPVTDAVSHTILTLPIYPNMSDEEREAVVASVLG